MVSKYKIRITGKDTKYFLRNLIKRGILLYSIDTSDKGLDLWVGEADYQKIREMKTSYEIKVLKITGKQKYKLLFHKYKIFLGCLFIGLLVITALSNIIFKVEVIHTKADIRELVLNNLEEFGIKKYKLKVSFARKEEIVKKILEKETDRLEWLEIENIGTKYVVRVEERKKTKAKANFKEQHIVAKKDAMLLSIDAEVGEVVKKKYDYVKKGDIIVSGFIMNNDKIKKKVSATGSIYGEVWYQVSVELPMHYREETITSDITRCLGFQFLDKNICLFDFKDFKTYYAENVKIVKSSLLPMEINFSKRRRTIVKEEVFDRKSGTEKALSLAEKKLMGKLSVKDSIISKKALKIVEKDSKIIVEVFFKVKEDITDFSSIEEIDIEEENQKEEVE